MGECREVKGGPREMMVGRALKWRFFVARLRFWGEGIGNYIFSVPLSE